MINAYKSFFKGYVDFAGRSTRSEYWWVWLGNMILSSYHMEMLWLTHEMRVLLLLWALSLLSILFLA